MISKKRARTGERIERRERKLFHCGVLYVYRGGRGGETWKQQILMIIHTSCRSGQSKIQSRKPQCAHASVPKERTWSTREQVISSFYMFQCPPKKGVQVATTARVHTRTNIRPHALNRSLILVVSFLRAAIAVGVGRGFASGATARFGTRFRARFRSRLGPGLGSRLGARFGLGPGTLPRPAA